MGLKIVINHNTLTTELLCGNFTGLRYTIFSIIMQYTYSASYSFSSTLVSK